VHGLTKLPSVAHQGGAEVSKPSCQRRLGQVQSVFPSRPGRHINTEAIAKCQLSGQTRHGPLMPATRVLGLLTKPPLVAVSQSHDCACKICQQSCSSIAWTCCQLSVTELEFAQLAVPAANLSGGQHHHTVLPRNSAAFVLETRESVQWLWLWRPLCNNMSRFGS